MEKSFGAATAVGNRIEPLPKRPGESGGTTVEYDFLSLACVSMVLEQDGEVSFATLRDRLKALGVAPVRSEMHVREELTATGLVTLGKGKVSVTETGVEYVKDRGDWVDGTYVSRGRKPKFLGESTYRFMNFFEEEAGPEGWVVDRLNTKISPVDFSAEMLDVERGTVARKLYDLRSRNLIEQVPEKPTAEDPMRNLRLTRFGEARLAAMRVMHANKIHRLEHGAGNTVNIERLPETDLEARIVAVHEEIGVMRRSLGEPSGDEPIELESFGKPELREMLTGLTGTLHELMDRMDSR